jgi:hypothetical protein
VVLIFLQEALGCLGHYHSPDSLVADSPLIVIGKIESVKEMGSKKCPIDRPGWSVASVRILRTIKGSYNKQEVDIHSGPIESCSLRPVHYRFAIGETCIFILPSYPENGESCLKYGGSLLGLEHVELVESRLNRAKSYRSKHIEDLKKTSPKVHKAAELLFNNFSKDSKEWPRSEEKENFEAIKEAVLKQLDGVDIKIIRTAIALDWLSDDPASWSKHPLWKSAMKELAAIRKKEVLKTRRVYIEKMLTEIGVTKKHIKGYMKSIPDSDSWLDDPLTFPPRLPDPWNTKREGDVLTTDFILRYHSYDRGAMFPAYGMGFEQFATLNPARLQEIIPALFGSADERLRTVAHWAINYIPGVYFIDTVLDRQVGNNCRTWRCLVSKDNKEQSQRRLSAMLKMAHEGFASFGIGYLYETLRQGECFEQVCIDAAIEMLSKVTEMERKEDSQAFYEEARPHNRIHAYLVEAVKYRTAEKPRKMMQEEYRRWFKGHPGPKEKK